MEKEAINLAATILITRHTGAATGSPAVGTTKTDITSTTNRMAYSDSPADGTSNPVPIPPSGTNRSWWVSTTLHCTVAPSNAVNNLKWYSDGTSFGTGLTCKGMDAARATGYTQATGSGGAGTSGTTLTTGNYTALSGATADVTTFTSGSPKSIAGSTTGTDSIGFGDFFVYQLEVTSTAAVGTMTARTISFQYDET